MPKYKCFSCMKTFVTAQSFPTVNDGGSCPHCGTIITDPINKISMESTSFGAYTTDFHSKLIPKLHIAMIPVPSETSGFHLKKPLATLRLRRFPPNVPFPTGWKCRLTILPPNDKNALIFIDEKNAFDFVRKDISSGITELTFDKDSPKEWQHHIEYRLQSGGDNHIVVYVEILDPFNQCVQTPTVVRVNHCFMSHHLLPTKKVIVAQKLFQTVLPPRISPISGKMEFGKGGWEADKDNEKYIKELQSALIGTGVELIVIKTETKDQWVRDMYLSGMLVDDTLTGICPSIMEIPVKRAKESEDTAEIKFKDKVEECLLKTGIMVERFSDIHVPISDQESGGNFLCMPPTKKYPYGCIIIGSQLCTAPEKIVIKNLENAGVQVCKFLQCRQPIATINTSWLQVGHVDEILTFIPWKGSKCGFKALIPSIDLTIKLFNSHKGCKLFDEEFIKNKNNELFISSFLQKRTTCENFCSMLYSERTVLCNIFKEMKLFLIELGVDAEDIVELPATFCQYKPLMPSFLGGCEKQNYVSSLPNSINMLVVTHPDGKTATLCIPKPYGPCVEESFLLEQVIIEILSPSGCSIKFIDDLKVCHMIFGNVHCSTLEIRETKSFLKL